eukprot:3332789-Amphidinium_carterae.2
MRAQRHNIEHTEASPEPVLPVLASLTFLFGPRIKSPLHRETSSKQRVQSSTKERSHLGCPLKTLIVLSEFQGLASLSLFVMINAAT